MKEIKTTNNPNNIVLYVCTPDETGEMDCKPVGEVLEYSVSSAEEPAPSHEPYVLKMDIKAYYMPLYHIGKKGLLQMLFARHKAKRAKMRKRIRSYCRELLSEYIEWAKLGWGYKPRLHPAANKPHRAKPYWHRTRSFCVRRGYH